MPRRVKPVLQHANDAGIGGDEVRQFVENERTRPVGSRCFRGQPGQERMPVPVVHVIKTAKPLRHGSREVASLHCGGGLIGNGVQTVVATTPLKQQSRLANAPAPPDDGECPSSSQRAVETPHFIVSVEKLHGAKLCI